MEFYGQPNAVAVSTIGHSPTWFDAVNSEFHYDQHRKQDIINPVLNLHESPLAMATALVKPIQSHMDYYQQPIPADHINDDSHLQLSPSSSSLYVDDNITTYAPCQGPQPWNFANFANCYGFYGQAPCPLVNIIDMEDFM